MWLTAFIVYLAFAYFIVWPIFWPILNWLYKRKEKNIFM